MAKRLTGKQERFINEYCRNGGNGTQAVIDAGYSCTYKAARVTAHRLLTNANIKEAIDSRRAVAVERSQITIERQLKEYEVNKEMARAKGTIAAANAALDSQNRIMGYFEKDNLQKGQSLIDILAIVGGSGSKQIESKEI